MINISTCIIVSAVHTAPRIGRCVDERSLILASSM